MYIEAPEIYKDGDENYLRLVVPNHPFEIIHNGKNIPVSEIYLAEPKISHRGECASCAVILERLSTYQKSKAASLSSSLSTEDMSRLLEIFQVEQKKKEEAAKIASENKLEIEGQDEAMLYIYKTSYIRDLLQNCNDFRDDKTDYWQELNRLADFISLRAKRKTPSGNIVPLDLRECFENYKGESFFILEEIVAYYFGFFFKFFPSKTIALA
jgi:hypothetical protein